MTIALIEWLHIVMRLFRMKQFRPWVWQLAVLLVACAPALPVDVGPAQAHPRDASIAGYLTQPRYVDLLNELQTKHGFDRAELQRLFGQATFRKEIPEKFAKPAESRPYDEYRPLFISPQIVDRGRRYMEEHLLLLKKIEAEFSVDAAVIVAILGVETKFGQRQDGGYLVFDALNTTFVGVPGRESFARKELIEFLLLCREEKIDPLTAKGSYAGAMGTPQFIASSYRHYTVDFDGDGRRDLWNSEADILASVANYLKRHNWALGAPIRVLVTADGRQPAVQALLDQGIDGKTTVEALLGRGVAWAGEPGMVDSGQEVSLLSYPTPEGEQTAALFPNFRTILTYNHAINYALVVSDLAERLAQPSGN